jgi:hypothetical protein
VVPSSMMSKVASALTAAVIVLALVNWYVKPEDALAWTAVVVMSVVMAVVLRGSRLAVRRSTGEAAAVRALELVTTAVVFAGLMMGIPLALTLARSYGLVDGTDVARRSTGVLIAVFLAMLGNVMPKNLPPLASMRCNGARQQAFLRRAGWTWVVCGLASAAGWIALPIDFAETATVVLVVTAMVVTLVHLVRLTRHRKDEPAHGLN